jgi:hypothetical protein
MNEKNTLSAGFNSVTPTQSCDGCLAVGQPQAVEPGGGGGGELRALARVEAAVDDVP